MVSVVPWSERSLAGRESPGLLRKLLTHTGARTHAGRQARSSLAILRLLVCAREVVAAVCVSESLSHQHVDWLYGEYHIATLSRGSVPECSDCRVCALSARIQGLIPYFHRFFNLRHRRC